MAKQSWRPWEAAVRHMDPASLPCFDYAAQHVRYTAAGGAVRPPLMRASTGAAPVGRSASSRAATPVELCGAHDRPASLLCLPALTVPPRQGRSRCGARGCACRSCARTWPPASATTFRRRARRSCGTCSTRRATACSCTRGSARCAPGSCSRRTACARRRGPPAARGRAVPLPRQPHKHRAHLEVCHCS